MRASARRTLFMTLASVLLRRTGVNKPVDEPGLRDDGRRAGVRKRSRRGYNPFLRTGVFRCVSSAKPSRSTTSCWSPPTRSSFPAKSPSRPASPAASRSTSRSSRRRWIRSPRRAWRSRIAQEGGIGIVHKNMPPARQAAEVAKVKRFESGVVKDPITIPPTMTVRDVLALTQQHRISGLAGRRRQARRRHRHQPRPALRDQPRPAGRQHHDAGRAPGDRAGRHRPRDGEGAHAPAPARARAGGQRRHASCAASSPSRTS